MTTAHDARLLPAALVAYGVAATQVAGVGPLPVLAALVLLGVAVWLTWRTALGGALLVATVAGLVVLVVALGHDTHRSQGGLRDEVGRGVVEVTGTAAREPVPVRGTAFDGEPRVRVPILIHGWAEHSQGSQRHWQSAHARVSVVSDQSWDEIGYGDTVTATMRLSPTRPGRDIAVAWDATLHDTRASTGVDRVVAHLRDGFRDATHDLNPEVRGLVRGMVVGDTSAMPDAQVQAMRVTSLAHLTAVSGAHFAIVLMASAGLLRLLKWPRRVRATVAALVMGSFALLVFPEPSVVRALAMALAVCAGLWWGRPAHALPALSCGVVALMLIDPFLTHSFGFALSVTAVASIVLWSPILAVHLQRWLPPVIAKAMAIPLAAQIACAPILVLLNPGIGLYGLPANLVAVVCAVPVTLLGLVSVVCATIHPAAGEFMAWLASLPAWPIAWASHGLADAPGAWLTWPSGPSGAVLMAVLSCVIIVATSVRTAGVWWRIAAAVVSVGLVVGLPPVRAAVGLDRYSIPDWQVVVCDVGQGHMMMVRAGPRAAVVIDVGSPAHGAPECLRRHGVRHVPLVILTHPHSDHDGAVMEVAESVRLDQAWVSHVGTEPPHDRAYQELLLGSVDVVVPQAGESVVVGDAGIMVLHAPQPRPPYDHSDLNDASIVVEAQVGDLTMLNLGDLEEAGQRVLHGTYTPPPHIDVVMVAHHGSASQHEPLVRSLNMSVAVIGVGEDNRHGHPTQTAIDLYSEGGTLVLRTDTCGDVVAVRSPHLEVAADCPALMGR